MLNLEDAIKHAEEVAKVNESWHEEYIDTAFEQHALNCKKCAEDHRQLAEWLKILKRVKFEFDEAMRIIYHPTPDVRDSDRKRAYAVIETFLFLQELDER